MNIVFLFNAGHQSLGNTYGFSVMDRILGAQVLQKTDRQMRVSYGDILTHHAVPESDLVEFCRKLYQPLLFDQLKHQELELTHGKESVFGWLFQNMTASIGKALHDKLSSDPAYLGAMDVRFSNPLHLRLFRNSLIEVFRLRGTHCSFFYQMGDNSDPDSGLEEYFKDLGYSIEYEDIGARRTIFDRFDTAKHFTRVENFVETFAGFPGLDLDITSDLAHNLEELHPQLFDELDTAASILSLAKTDGDVARAAWSGRRFLENTADCLFPADEPDRNGKMIAQAEYRNRILAYIEDTGTSAGIPPVKLTKLGKEAERLFDLFNGGLPTDQRREKVEATFASLVKWLSLVIALSPAAARRPFL